MKMNAVYVLIGLILGLVACSCLGKTREGFQHKKNKYQEDKKQLHPLPSDSAGSMRMPGQEEEDDEPDAVNDEHYEDHNGSKYASVGSSAATSSALPKGIPQSQIPKGSEDLYILKSEVVPPVCPACPTVMDCPKQKKCQPCPPCARCPEPNFTCKKVPNYSAPENNQLPLPYLNSFSSF